MVENHRVERAKFRMPDIKCNAKIRCDSIPERTSEIISIIKGCVTQVFIYLINFWRMSKKILLVFFSSNF